MHVPGMTTTVAPPCGQKIRILVTGAPGKGYIPRVAAAATVATRPRHLPAGLFAPAC